MQLFIDIYIENGKIKIKFKSTPTVLHDELWPASINELLSIPSKDDSILFEKPEQKEVHKDILCLSDPNLLNMSRQQVGTKENIYELPKESCMAINWLFSIALVFNQRQTYDYDEIYLKLNVDSSMHPDYRDKSQTDNFVNNVTAALLAKLIEFYELHKNMLQPYSSVMNDFIKLSHLYNIESRRVFELSLAKCLLIENRCKLLYPNMADTILNPNISSDIKIKLILKEVRPFIHMNEKIELTYMLKSIHLLAKKTLFSACLGKERPSGSPFHTLYYLWSEGMGSFIRYADFHQRDDGRISIVNISRNKEYLRWTHSNLNETLTHWGKVMKLEFDHIDSTEAIFSTKSSNELRLHGLHYTENYIKRLLKIQNQYSIFSPALRNDKDTHPMPHEIDRNIFRHLADKRMDHVCDLYYIPKSSINFDVYSARLYSFSEMPKKKIALKRNSYVLINDQDLYYVSYLKEIENIDIHNVNILISHLKTTNTSMKNKNKYLILDMDDINRLITSNGGHIHLNKLNHSFVLYNGKLRYVTLHPYRKDDAVPIRDLNKLNDLIKKLVLQNSKRSLKIPLTLENIDEMNIHEYHVKRIDNKIQSLYSAELPHILSNR